MTQRGCRTLYLGIIRRPQAKFYCSSTITVDPARYAVIPSKARNLHFLPRPLRKILVYTNSKNARLAGRASQVWSAFSGMNRGSNRVDQDFNSAVIAGVSGPVLSHSHGLDALVVHFEIVH